MSGLPGRRGGAVRPRGGPAGSAFAGLGAGQGEDDGQARISKAPSDSQRSARQEPRNTYLQARHKRLTARRGPLRALVAVEHSIITAIWHTLTDHVPYHELGGTYFTQRDPERATGRAITALNQLGYTVTLNPIEGTA
ncbi:hypothetical protein I2W78_08725 [Streptomyces spinoverrucosus]|uniref:hypothetical protein n=1 Tax=Streptomyces spinoverrucosus TaxID=284043 RepID=UPI0018C41780|nr:hypothetical protein [Streptomyces spinoverrucosus]MBG0851923.1 hypothetical protein [Streptomyces spinoverrucosus]